MVQVQVDIDGHQDKMLKIYMAYNFHKSKADSIKAILDEYFLIRPPKLKYDTTVTTPEPLKEDDKHVE